MALNLQTFKTRTITAIIFAVVMLAGLLTNHWTFFILFCVIHFGCWMEYQRLIGLIDNKYHHITIFHKNGVMLAGWCVLLYFTNDRHSIFGLELYKAGWWLGLISVFVLPLLELLFNPNIRLKNVGYSFLGLIYISLSFGLMIDLSKQFEFHVQGSTFEIPFWGIPVFIIGCIWVNDTLAYIMGSLVGKTPLSKISPRKTWEGTISGIVLAIALGGILAWQLDLPLLFLMIPAGVIAVSGTFGDLLQSKLKRMANVKDSGTFMPGHGGFLDRFDSILLATPFLWLYIMLVK